MPFPRRKQQELEERQAEVEYELRCLLNKPGQCVTELYVVNQKPHWVLFPECGQCDAVQSSDMWCFVLNVIHTVVFTFRGRLESEGTRSRAEADEGAGRCHRTEEPDHQHLGSGQAEVHRKKSNTWGFHIHRFLCRINATLFF